MSWRLPDYRHRTLCNVIIIGIDPGYARVGVGIIEKIGSKIKHIHHTCIQTPSTDTEPARLTQIYQALQNILIEYAPSEMAVESLFFNANTTTAFSVAQARGVILLAADVIQIPTQSYSPLQIKSSVTGYGRASKTQVQYMVQKLLNLAKKPTPDDAADGLAIAICHSHHFSHKIKTATPTHSIS